MMLDEQDNFIQQIMANCDTAISAIAESMTQMGTSEGTWWKEKSMIQILSDPAGE
jgi:hypothetical protein